MLTLNAHQVENGKLAVLSVNLNKKFNAALQEAVSARSLEINILTAYTEAEAVKIFKENDLRVILLSAPYIGGYNKESIGLASYFRARRKKVFVLCGKEADVKEFEDIGCYIVNNSVAEVVATLKWLGF